LGIVEFVLATERKRCVAEPDSSTADLLEAAVSPDGNTVAFVRESTAWVRDLYTVSLRGGIPRRLTFEANRIEGLMWDKDGRNIIFGSTRGGTTGSGIWKIAANGGPIEPEMSDNYFNTESRDGRRRAYLDGKYTGNIWRALLAGPGGKLLSQKKIIDSSTIDLGPELSPDGKQIVYMSALSGAGNTWRSEADGSNPLQLTSFGGEVNGTPRWSPDGKWIVFDRRPNDHAQIYVSRA
jgi:Tol biopolymer transport system component